MKLALNICDNDFWKVFYEVLDIINKEYLLTRDKCKFKGFTKEEYRILINEISYGIYLLYQSKFRSGYSLNKDYLEIKENQIFMNEEVDKLIKECEEEDNDYNSELFILDTSIKINPIFSR